MTDRRLRAPLLSCLCLLASLALLGCGDGLDLEADALPGPILILEAPVATCAGAGGATIAYELDDVVVTQNLQTHAPANRVTISGTVSGVPDGDGLFLVLLDDDFDCPVLDVFGVTVTDGAFTAVGDIGGLLAFRALLVTHSGVDDDIDCDVDTGCLLTAAGSFSGISNTLDARLRE